jgi:lipid II isoglutaminyl synthase (glutamine-hydrolysing)
MAAPLQLRIAHLYPQELNLYGDRGNLLTLYRRCQWREIACQITPIGLGQAVHPEAFDLYFMGGGQDAQQTQVAEDLQQVKAASLKLAAHQKAVFLTICGGYQLLGHYYKPHHGPELRGLSLIDAYTIAGNTRMIGNVVIKRLQESDLTFPQNKHHLVGFENHSGQTFLGPDLKPLGHVLQGHGNNGQDGGEGALSGTLYGTYLHGSLLPKNPTLADELIALGLQHRYGKTIALTPLEDSLEDKAHHQMLAK